MKIAFPGYELIFKKLLETKLAGQGLGGDVRFWEWVEAKLIDVRAARTVVSADGQRIDDAFELLPDVGRKGRRRGAHAADFTTTVEIVGAMQRHVLWRLFLQEKERDPQHGGILFLRAATHSLHAGIVGHVLVFLHDLATLNLPKTSDIVHVIEALANESIGESHRRLPSVLFAHLR
jgi:hypothetical protein